MAFSDETVRKAFSRAKGRCECNRTTHIHFGRCNHILNFNNRGRTGAGAWEAHHRTSVRAGGADSLSNCEILCWDCHSKTF